MHPKGLILWLRAAWSLVWYAIWTVQWTLGTLSSQTPRRARPSHSVQSHTYRLSFSFESKLEARILPIPD
ncbi:hypothetical protein EJ05DRAFT_138219 [Pseudovirgaria hyperparasitica]|uniref:Uncharacterized protein n=1 Tax=Pseudovirgaria hyperparasitica TaxID=470096 RepID=A0A6A6VWF6_9PEZI|nr:uncharacterized protein EJ05DRAFT_138219 [Pseudovirgaria hyperparasitica]KAF2754922.1 hypothetical protein EJ05DRAFT_138219 [Pseudovirgaria hyperparasitica]